MVTETGKLNAPITSVVAADMVTSADGTILYVAGTDGKVRAYDVASRSLIATWNVGMTLAGIEIAPDGSFLMVAERQPNGAWGQDGVYRSTSVVYKVSTASGAVSTFSLPVTGNSLNFYDVAILANGSVLISQETYSGWLPLWSLDLASGGFTATAQTYANRGTLKRSTDATHVVFTPTDISSAPIHVWESGLGITHSYDSVFDSTDGYNGPQAISLAINRIVQITSSDASIYDSDLNYLGELPLSGPLQTNVYGAIFDPTGTYLYLLSNEDDSIYQLATADWSVVRTFSVGADVGYAVGGFGNRLQLSPDGRYFMVLTEGGVRLVENDSLDNSFTGTPGNDVLAGGTGDDVLQGAGGDDNLEGGTGDDDLDGGTGNDLVSGGEGNDTLRGGAGTDSYSGGEGIDTLDFSGESGPVAVNLLTDQAIGALLHPLATRHVGPNEALDSFGNYEALSGIENFILTGGSDMLFGSEGADRVEAGGGNDQISGEGGNDVLLGGSGNDSLYGHRGDDRIEGGSGGDQLQGGDGNDWIDAGAGDDFALGHAGNDTLHGGDGFDNVRGDEGNDTLSGGADGDFLIGGPGVDSFDGGANQPGIWSGDFVSFQEFLATQGAVADLRTGSISNDGFGNVETMIGIESLYGGTAFADTFHGNDQANRIYADRGDSVQAYGGDDWVELGLAAALADGGAGTDTLWLRNDGGFLLPDSDGDGWAELSGPIAGGWTADLDGGFLRDGLGNVGSIANFENIEGSGGNDYLTGNAGANLLIGGGGDDVLIGGGGGDRTVGGLGNDSHLIDNPGDIVVEFANEGTDTVATSISYTLTANVENLQAANIGGADPLSLTGNGLANYIWGTQGNNVIDGGGGVDFMIGYAGDDVYHVDNAGDLTYEESNWGSDTVVASVDYRLGANIENLQALAIAGNAALALTGNALNNFIWGTQGNNILDGAGGADFMLGYAGDDIYHVDHAGDIAYELDGGGTDTVVASISHTLSGNVENLQALNIGGTDPLSLTGNDLRNFIWGTQGNNVIDGGAGADLMIGYGGNDVYFVDNAGDVTYEEVGGGSDTVAALTSYALGANIENLQAANIGGTAALSLTGNEQNNFIWGTQGNNVLSGRGGNDRIFGFAGADQFLFDTAAGAANADWLDDFQAGTDKILLDNAVFTALTDGALPASAFVTGSSALDADDRIIFDAASGSIFYDADGNGAGQALLIAYVPVGQALTAADILVV